VVRELLLGPKRYIDLQRGLPNVSPNVLSDRLRELERDALAAVLWGQASLTDAQRSETMTIEGDTTAAKRFFRLFPLPEPAAAVSAS
jgi:hypothetical protein